MLIKTNIAKTVEEVDTKARYDTAVKKVLSDPQILAWILKYTVKEFSEYNISDIMACIEGEPEVACHPLHSGFYTKPLENVSIEVAEPAEQRVTYGMNKEDIYGHMASTANHRYDLMELVMVCLGRPEKAIQGTELHQLLNTVLSEKLTPQEKQKIMKEEYDIVTTVELEGGLAKMCNLSEYIEEKAMEKGIQQGIVMELVSLVKDGLLPLEVAAQRAKVTIEEMKSMCQLI